MTTTTKNSLIALAVLGAVTLGANSALAFGPGGEGKGPRHGGDREGLVPTELREEFRAEKKAELENMTDEERQAFFEEKRTAHEERRAEKKAAFEEFTGLTKEEIKEQRESGFTMGEILANQGIDEAEATTFVTDTVSEKANAIIEKHDVSDEDAQTILDRVQEMIQKILDKWYNTSTS